MNKLIIAVEILRVIDKNPGIIVADIAQMLNISISYIEQHLSPLRKGGFVKAVRGPGGGYWLCDNVSFPNIILYDLAVALGLEKPKIGCRAREEMVGLTDFAKQLTISEVLR